MDNQQETPTRVLVVRATHEYVPVLNDELHIHVNDTIVVTNAEEGGWWEGTLGNQTGWFPSNYVVETEQTGTKVLFSTHEYTQTIIDDLVESECKLVDEMEQFLEERYEDLCSKIGDCEVVRNLKSLYLNILGTHEQLLGDLKSDLRVGTVLLNAGQSLTSVHTEYCRHHSRYVCLVESRLGELCSDDEPDAVLRIISCLSSPFRRISTYAQVLSKLVRVVPPWSPDRGPLQRSACFYTDLDASLSNLRKLKEIELELLVPGAIHKCTANVSELGQLVLMDLVVVNEVARFLVLFSTSMLVLSYDWVTSCWEYHGNVRLSSLCVRSVGARSFEIRGSSISYIAHCPSSSIKSTWISKLNELISQPLQCHDDRTDKLLITSPPYIHLVNHFKHLQESSLLRKFTAPCPMKRFKCLSKLHQSNSPRVSSTAGPRRPVLVRQDAFDYGDDEHDSVDSGCGGSCYSESFSSNVLIELEESGPVYTTCLYAHWGLKYECS